jgi:hypothetical protein
LFPGFGSSLGGFFESMRKLFFWLTKAKLKKGDPVANAKKLF